MEEKPSTPQKKGWQNKMLKGACIGALIGLPFQMLFGYFNFKSAPTIIVGFILAGLIWGGTAKSNPSGEEK